MGILSRCQVALELDSCVNFKKKAALKKKIIDNDGIVSFIVTKKVVVFLHREYDHLYDINVYSVTLEYALLIGNFL